MKIVILFALLATVYAGLVLEDNLGASFQATLEWPENDDTSAGAIVAFAYADIGTGSCTVQTPNKTLVKLFHAMNAHVVPEGTTPAEGTYKLAAPAEWEAVNGTINVLIIFDKGKIFNISELTFTCDQGDEQDLSVYSFPQNTLQKEASSNVFYRPGFHVGDVLTITLQYDVARFNITGADSRWEIEQVDKVITVSGFQNEEGIDDQKEVHFSLEYNEEDWFSAGNVGVTVTKAPEEEPEI